MIVLGGAVSGPVEVGREFFKGFEQFQERLAVGSSRGDRHWLDMQFQGAIHRQLQRFIWNKHFAVEMGLHHGHTQNHSRRDWRWQAGKD